jgi:two-component system LytT family response regulator
VLTYALVEDEAPGRLRLKALLRELRPGSVCLAEAEDGDGGLHLLRMCRPDVLFLDIEFPPGGAFGLLEAAAAEGLALPPVVFVTAFSSYAIEAFRWSAWDYLLKPVARPRLEETLARIEARLAPAPDLAPLLQALEASRRQEAPERFTVQAKGGLRVLAWADVSHLVTENRLLFVHTPEGRFILGRTLEELETVLAPRFFRCHRGAMVALARVRELRAEAEGNGEVRLDAGERVPVSRDRMAELRRRLG